MTTRPSSASARPRRLTKQKNPSSFSSSQPPSPCLSSPRASSAVGGARGPSSAKKSIRFSSEEANDIFVTTNNNNMGSGNDTNRYHKSPSPTSRFPTIEAQELEATPPFPQTENKSAHLLRGIVSAEVQLHKKSILEILIGTFLKSKSDVKVLRDFAAYFLTKPLDVDSKISGITAHDVFSTDISDSKRIFHILQLIELKEKIVYDVCSGLLKEHELGMRKALEPLPDSCSPNLISLLNLIGTFTEIAKDISNPRRKKDPAEERNIQTLQENYKDLESAYTSLKADHKSLRTKYENIMTDGGKLQGVARKQHAIDELELKVKNMAKTVEDAEAAKKEALRSELKMKDELLQVTTQLDNLRESYEGEIGSLKPMIHEQVTYTNASLNEIRDLRTNVSLGKERYSLLWEQHEKLREKLEAARVETEDYEERLSGETERADNLQQEVNRLDKLLKVTTAAKLSSDDARRAVEDEKSALAGELEEVRRALQREEAACEDLSAKLRTSEGAALEASRQSKELHQKYRAKCCEVVALESSLNDQSVHIDNLLARLGQEATGMKPISLDLKPSSKKRNGIGGSSAQIPVIDNSSTQRGVRFDDGGGDRSQVLQRLQSSSEQSHAEEVRKKDAKIKKLEEKLRKSQAQLKEALDRVFSLEKVKIDEASGAIPQRKHHNMY